MGSVRSHERPAGLYFEPTPHHYQVALYADGRIDLSYQQITARDAIVGVFSIPDRGAPAANAVDLSVIDESVAPRPRSSRASIHYGLPRAENMACTVIDAFGDHFDFMGRNSE